MWTVTQCVLWTVPSLSSLLEDSRFLYVTGTETRARFRICSKLFRLYHLRISTERELSSSEPWSDAWPFYGKYPWMKDLQFSSAIGVQHVHYMGLCNRKRHVEYTRLRPSETTDQSRVQPNTMGHRQSPMHVGTFKKRHTYRVGLLNPSGVDLD